MPQRASSSSARSDNGAYTVPFVGLRLPEGPVNATFWAGLVGAALVGAVEAPLAALVGAGVLVARHRRAG